MLISTGLPLPMCSSMSESEAFAPSSPRCSVSCSPRVTPSRESSPAISQFVPAEVPVNAGRLTVRFSFPLTQKYVPPMTSDDHEHDDADDQGDPPAVASRLAPEPPAPTAAARRRAAGGRGPVAAGRSQDRRRTRDRPRTRSRQPAPFRDAGPALGGTRRRLLGPGAPPAARA